MARIIIHANLGRYCWWASEKGSKLCVVKEVSDFFDLANARMHQSQSGGGGHRPFSLFLSTPFDVSTFLTSLRRRCYERGFLPRRPRVDQSGTNVINLSIAGSDGAVNYEKLIPRWRYWEALVEYAVEILAHFKIICCKFDLKVHWLMQSTYYLIRNNNIKDFWANMNKKVLHSLSEAAKSAIIHA